VRILIDYRPALRARTGVGEYAHQISAALARQLGPDDSLVLFSSSWKDRLAADVLDKASVVDIRVPVTVLNLLWHRLEWPAIEQFAGPVDVVHSMHPLLMPARRAAQVVTIHDLYFLDAPENTQAEIRRDYPRLAERHAHRADAVVTVSAYSAGRIEQRLAVPRDRLAVCPNGAPAWPALEHYNHGGHVLFMGTIEPRKNVGVLLQAYAQLLDRRPSSPPLVLAGGVSAGSEPVLEAIRRPPLEGHVKHVGYVTGAMRERLYREASMLILPSLDEGFGLPALEAMTLGIPVIVSSRGALPEVVGSAGTVIDANDASGFASAMDRLLSDESYARMKGTEGVTQSRTFDWDDSARRLIATYRLAIDRRRARS
jgi:glycosyltransferase involved in cell wall biosynthesis